MIAGNLTMVTRGRYRTLNARGTHQRFDRKARKLMLPQVSAEQFPNWSQLLSFEGYNGPDGLKLKGNYTTDHFWDPINELGFLPDYIASHFRNLVTALRVNDLIEASFHAVWLSHYLTDSMTPCHHISHKLIAAEYQGKTMRKKWLYWGRKGIMSSHLAFEFGVQTSIMVQPIRVSFDQGLYRRILRDGIVAVVKDESRSVAQHHIYRDFLRSGWTVPLARQTRKVVINRIPQIIAAAWQAAYAEAGLTIKK